MAKQTATLPLCSLAYKLDEKSEMRKNTEALANKYRSSRFFCYLPMPQGIEHSGLPFHIHGSFGLNDNRREFTWLSDDNRDDESARWNHTLLDEVLDSTLVNTIAYARACISTCSADMIDLAEFYYLVPVWENASGNWREKHLSSFFRRLGEIDLVMNERGEWTRLGDVWLTNEIDSALDRFFLGLNSDSSLVAASLREAVLKCFEPHRLPKIAVPQHVIQAYEKFHTTSITSLKSIQLDDLCSSLRHCRPDKIDEIFSSDQKRLVLNFLLESVTSLGQLDGVRLLPRRDSTWTHFGDWSNKDPNDRVFVFASEADDQRFVRVLDSSVLFDKSLLTKTSSDKLIHLLSLAKNKNRLVVFDSQTYLFLLKYKFCNF